MYNSRSLVMSLRLILEDLNWLGNRVQTRRLSQSRQCGLLGRQLRCEPQGGQG